MTDSKQKLNIFWIYFFAFGIFSFLFFITSASDAQAGESVGVGWTAPTTNADDTPLTDLAGFTLYYDTISHSGTCPSIYGDSSPYANSINIGAGTVNQVIDNLGVGNTYYFTIVAYDEDHNMSTCTSEITHVVHYSADFDNSYCVGLGDWSPLHANYGQSGSVAEGDANRDGTINISDWSILHSEYGQGACP